MHLFSSQRSDSHRLDSHAQGPEIHFFVYCSVSLPKLIRKLATEILAFLSSHKSSPLVCSTWQLQALRISLTKPQRSIMICRSSQQNCAVQHSEGLIELCLLLAMMHQCWQLLKIRVSCWQGTVARQAGTPGRLTANIEPLFFASTEIRTNIDSPRTALKTASAISVHQYEIRATVDRDRLAVSANNPCNTAHCYCTVEMMFMIQTGSTRMAKLHLKLPNLCRRYFSPSAQKSSARAFERGSNTAISSHTNLAMLVEDYLWAKMRQFNTVPGSKLPPARCNGHFKKLSAKFSRRAEKFQVQAASSLKDAVDSVKKTVTEKISQPADKAKDTADRVSETISAPPLAPSAIASVPKEETVLLQGLLSVSHSYLTVKV